MVLWWKHGSVSVNALKRHCKGESTDDHRSAEILTNMVLIIRFFVHLFVCLLETLKDISQIFIKGVIGIYKLSISCFHLVYYQILNQHLFGACAHTHRYIILKTGRYKSALFAPLCLYAIIMPSLLTSSQ